MVRRLISILALALAVLAAQLSGVLRPLDNWLLDRRFESVTRPASGDIVLVDIDAHSLAALGQWPWPRSVHARLIDRLVALGAGEIAVDVDFSARSSEAEDAALEAALARAGDGVVLVAFDQKASAGGGIQHTRPAQRFADHAWVASVEVRLDRDGQIRRLPYGEVNDGDVLPSLAATLGGGAGDLGTELSVDFGIDAAGIDRISASDLLAGTVPAERVAGKKVIVGATAVELRDYFNVPVYGAIPGALLQALGAESILQGRALARTSSVVVAAGLCVFVVLALFLQRRRWIASLAALAFAAVAVEASATVIQRLLPLQVSTGAWLVGILGFGLATVLREIDFRRILIAVSRAETRNAQTILDRVVSDSFAGILVIDESGAVVAASRSAGAILQIEGELVGRDAGSILPDEIAIEMNRDVVAMRAGTWREQGMRTAEYQRSNGAGIVEYVVTPSRMSGGFAEDGEPLAERYLACLTFLDVTERRRAAARLAFLARFDTLTGLPNRNQFLERLETILVEASPPVVICVDLDRFKMVNDTLGHAVGDLLLRAIGLRLTGMVGAMDFVARLGGDDFAVVVTGADAAERAGSLAGRLVSAVGTPYELEGHRLVVAMSAGVAAAVRGDEALTVLKHADTALYRAKAAGGNAVVTFEPAMIAGLAERQQMEVDLWDAFEKGEFELFYQPQVDLRDGRIVGAEALVRWRHPARGMVPPSEFIPVVEAIGLMEPLGRWILATATRAARRWPVNLRIAVNVSPVQFGRGNLVEAIRFALEESGLAPHRLEIEITESLFLQEHRSLTEALQQIAAMGVALAIDDFGIGYSSLSYVRRFPIDKIKIDRTFVEGIPTVPESVAIVRAISALSESLGMRLIAEGVEDAEQVRFLRLLGCNDGQGFLFGAPMPAAEFHALIMAGEARAEARRLAG